MSLTLLREDITRLQVDAIVNTANPAPVIGGGADYAIHLKAGKQLLNARKQIGDINPGKAYITEGFNLKAKYVIHTVSPYYHDDEFYLTLKKCYRKSLKLAKNNGCESIAFPLIGAGTCGIPTNIALEAANNAINEFLRDNEMEIYLTVLDRKSFRLSYKLYDDVKCYIDDNLAEERLEEYHYRRDRFRRYMKECRREVEEDFEEYDAAFGAYSRIANEVPFPEPIILGSREPDWKEIEEEEGFSEVLMKKIIASGRTDADVYKAANLDRKHFSKIRNNKDYQPKKYTALALAISLRLDLHETLELIGKAGYTLTRSSKGDIIVEYFITHENYNITDINEVLFSFNQPLLGFSR